MVAICGWIMPDPLAMPRSVTVRPFTLNLRDAILRRVSVVKIASGNRETSSRVPRNDATSSGRQAMILSDGSRTPMIPIDDGKMRASDVPSRVPSALQLLEQASSPAAPVAQFAFPEFTKTASRRPRVFFKEARPISMGAATTRFRVNTEAAVEPMERANATSGRPLALIPADKAANANPDGTRMGSGLRRSALIR